MDRARVVFATVATFSCFGHGASLSHPPNNCDFAELLVRDNSKYEGRTIFYNCSAAGSILRKDAEYCAGATEHKQHSNPVCKQNVGTL